MEKSDYDFSVPTRQSTIAIVMILVKTINVVVRQIFPVFVVFLLGGSNKKEQFIIVFLVTITALSMIYSIINFFRTYFIIQNNEIILHTGVFKRKKISVPFERIQTINFEQNILHQFFSVLKIKLDTAGSEKNEFEFHALAKDKAYIMRDLIMAQKEVISQNETSHQVKPVAETDSLYQEIMHITPIQLLKVGITENHIKSGGLIFVFFFWIYQSLSEVGVDMWDYSEDLPLWVIGFYSIIGLLVLFLFASIVISLGRTLITHYDLKFLRSTSGFKVESGLFTKKETSALDHKIQIVSWSDNLLKRRLGFKDLALNQASSHVVTSTKRIKIPGCNMQHIRQVTSTLFGINDFDNAIPLFDIDKRYFVRYASIILFLMCLISIGLIMAQQYDKVVFIPFVCIYLCAIRYMSFKKIKYGINDELIYIRGGIFGDKAEIMPIFKIQSVEMYQSPYQSKHQLATMYIYTASGKLKIPYIQHKICVELMNIILYKSESDNRKWM